jgi:hypothetical protein
MSRKPKFRPEIRRIKLNPEQAVLVCDCWNDAARPFDLAPAVTNREWAFDLGGNMCLPARGGRASLVSMTGKTWAEAGMSMSS